MGIKTWSLVSVTLFVWRNPETAFPLLSLKKEIIGFLSIAACVLVVWQYSSGKGLNCYVIHSLLSFELFDDAWFYSCVLPQELDLNMLRLVTWWSWSPLGPWLSCLPMQCRLVTCLCHPCSTLSLWPSVLRPSCTATTHGTWSRTGRRELSPWPSSLAPPSPIFSTPCCSSCPTWSSVCWPHAIPSAWHCHCSPSRWHFHWKDSSGVRASAKFLSGQPNSISCWGFSMFLALHWHQLVLCPNCEKSCRVRPHNSLFMPINSGCYE